MSSDPFGFDPKTSQPAIRVDNVSKHYVMFERPEDRFKQMVVPRLQRLVGRPPKRYFRDFAALNGVSLEVGRGETVGIIGRNGSGKSTLLQIICGTLQPTSGAVEVNGRIAALLELGAGFNPEFTGRENVFLNAQILGVPRHEIEWRFDDIARFADIGPFIDQPVKTYSSGMYVRLAFATAINVDPDILVVDEALSVGDEAFQRKCFARIEDIKDKGGTILFVSHGAQTIVQLCTRAVLIDAGEKLLEGAPKTVVSQYQRLVNLMGEQAAAVRTEIARMGENGPVTDNTKLPSGPAAAQAAPASMAASPVVSNLEDDNAWLDPSLISRSQVEYETQGAQISGLRVLTLDGRQVNVLSANRRYVIEYNVQFLEDANNVSFGFAVRTVTGLTLAGAMSTGIKERLIDTKSGDIVLIRFEFACLMLADTYFIGCSVYGIGLSNTDLMHRITDGLAIRVTAQGNILPRGHFNLDPDLEICADKPTVN